MPAVIDAARAPSTESWTRGGLRAPVTALRALPALLVVVIALVLPSALAAEIVINEIHYEPEDKTAQGEFIEIHNTGSADVDVSGWYFSEGVAFTFPAGTLVAAGGYLVIAEDAGALVQRYGDLPVVGPYDGRLANDGETLILRDADGELVDVVDYRAEFPWPIAPAGSGSSMELIHPALDNDLGGSWRASGSPSTGSPTRRYLVASASAGWRYRKGTSNPPSDWRSVDFAEDASWASGRAGFGYDDGDDNTLLDDMRNGYSTVYFRHEFIVGDDDPLPPLLKLGVYADDGAIVSLSGVEIDRFHVSAGDKDYDDLAESHEAEWEEIVALNATVRRGRNVLAAHGLNTTLNSSDFSFDATLFVPADGEIDGGVPSPGARNTVYSENAPPQIRQVETATRSPTSRQTNIVTTKVTDPDGVASVRLIYQIVPPGNYIPAFLPVPLATLLGNAETPRPPNAAFEAPANWTTIEMFDDGVPPDAVPGDGVYTSGIIEQSNRTLVRYRIEATDLLGATVRVPYADDPSLNFAYFVYDGVPDYVASTSITGQPTTHDADALQTVPVYHVITRNQDLVQARAASAADQIPQGNQARFAENWEAAFVYEGFVYDHVVYRLRGANGRYQVPPGNPSGIVGKRHWRFRFNDGNHLRARDRWRQPYPTRWKWLNIGRMFGNRLDGNWGLPDHVNDMIWIAYGVPAGPIPAAAALRITELMYNPPGGSDYEFVELQNIGEETLDLTNVRLTSGVEFDFADGDVTSLEPGAFVLVVRHRATFATRYDTSTLPIAGEYSGRLDNGGEAVIVTFGASLDFLSFRYEGEWHPEADGQGRSLTMVDPRLPLELWGRPESWFPSSVLDGTPGRADDGGAVGGLALPGDANGDGRLDVSDAVKLLRALFLGALEPPCEGGWTDGSGNVALLDFDGDESVSITDAIATLDHLFREGPAHALGSGCVRIEGCPFACFAP